MAAAGTREGSRRQHERAAVEIRIDVSPDSTARFVSARSCNASEGGVFVATDALLRIDARVKVGFMPDDGQEPVRGSARVVWVREDSQGDACPEGAGLQFVSFEADGAARVAAWCSRLRSRQPAAPPPIPPRPEVVTPAAESHRSEVFDGTGVYLTKGIVDSKVPRTDVFVVNDELEDTAVLPPRRNRRRGRALWLAAVVVIVGLVVAGVVFRDRLSGWFERFAAGTEPEVAGVVSPSVQAPDEPLAGGASTVPEETSEPAAGSGAETTTRADAAPASRAGVEPATGAGAEPAAGPPSLLEVRCVDQGDTSLATLVLSGPVDIEQVAVDTLADPPRILVRLVGVTGGPESAETAIDGPRVHAYRSGFHRDLDPPEVHVVLDLADSAAGVVGWWIEGNDVAVLLGAPSAPTTAASTP